MRYLVPFFIIVLALTGCDSSPGSDEDADILTHTITLKQHDYSDIDGIETAYYSIPIITENVAVLAYMKLPREDIWSLIPLSVDNVTITFDYSEEEFIVTIIRPYHSFPFVPYLHGTEIKVVILFSSSSQELEDVDTKDFTAVARALNLP